MTRTARRTAPAGLMPSTSHHLRIARPVRDLDSARQMYCRGLGLRVVGSFVDHDGFDGVMLGSAGACYHLEFTRSRRHPARPAPSMEDLLVLYIPSEPEWLARCAAMLAAGFRLVPSFNPYWETNGRTFEDDDGYRVVLQREEWRNVESA